LTGYHAWVFFFMALVFHLPIAIFGQWSWRVEARILGALALFWIVEDWLWFVLNPALGLGRFTSSFIPWHKHWFGSAPIDYWLFGGIGLLLLAGSCCWARARE
jgi:hypothetical protein